MSYLDEVLYPLLRDNGAITYDRNLRGYQRLTYPSGISVLTNAERTEVWRTDSWQDAASSWNLFIDRKGESSLRISYKREGRAEDTGLTILRNAFVYHKLKKEILPHVEDLYDLFRPSNGGVNLTMHLIPFEKDESEQDAAAWVKNKCDYYRNHYHVRFGDVLQEAEKLETLESIEDEALRSEVENFLIRWYTANKSPQFSGRELQICDNQREIFKQEPHLYTISAGKLRRSQSANGATFNTEKNMNYTLQSLNTILYGPPGTGKTYNTKRYAVATCGGTISDDADIKKQYKDLVEEGRIKFVTFHQSYGYEEFIQGIAAKVNEKTHQVEYTTKDGVFVRFCEEARGKEEPYIFIIDEINRGNISKIFGELITLIEDTKREGCDDAQSAELPHGGRFSVPKNVYILGTMNTADRSIALLDTALRRRFDFIEMMPKPDVLKVNVKELKKGELKVDKLLESINARIEFLYDREHTIGHAFFTPLLKEDNRTIETLKQIFRNKVIPLLQEYFYDDYEKIQQVLGASFVKSIEPPPSLKSAEEGKRYMINSSDLWDFTECFEKNEAETKQDETE